MRGTIEEYKKEIINMSMEIANLKYLIKIYTFVKFYHSKYRRGE